MRRQLAMLLPGPERSGISHGEVGQKCTEFFWCRWKPQWLQALCKH